MLKRFFIAALMFLAASSVAYSATDIPGGPVTGEWTAEGSPYRVHGDITIAGLVINPCVEVRVDANCGIYVQVALFAEGTATCPIIFTAADPASRWTGIDFTNVAPGSILDQCRVEYANNSGIRLTNSTPVIKNCVISNNNNHEGSGGGMWVSVPGDTLELKGCRFIDNYAYHNDWDVAQTFGGGVYMAAGDLRIANCDFVRNTCHTTRPSNAGGYGGGLYLDSGDHEIMHCLFAENTASSYTSSYGNAYAYGGGLYCVGSVEIHNTVVVCNVVATTEGTSYRKGGGCFVSGDLTMFNCVVANNWFEGIYMNGGTAFVRNSILYDNAVQASGSVEIAYSCVEDGWPGTDNIDYNPAFRVPGGCARANYRIMTYSPCVDAGDPDPIYNDNCRPPAHGEARNDMGAYGGPNVCPGYSAVGPQSPTVADLQILLPNHPNPFGSSTTIHFDLPEPEKVNLRVYDSAGRLVRTLIAGESRTAGRYSRVWDGVDDKGLTVPSGVYFYRLETSSHSESRRMTLTRR
jgi:FlgD Ig-like domain/Right handed beta helix region